jgi:hypothetical protein
MSIIMKVSYMKSNNNINLIEIRIPKNIYLYEKVFNSTRFLIESAWEITSIF